MSISRINRWKSRYLVGGLLVGWLARCKHLPRSSLDKRAKGVQCREAGDPRAHCRSCGTFQRILGSPEKTTTNRRGVAEIHRRFADRRRVSRYILAASARYEVRAKREVDNQQLYTRSRRYNVTEKNPSTFLHELCIRYILSYSVYKWKANTSSAGRSPRESLAFSNRTHIHFFFPRVFHKWCKLQLSVVAIRR